jgi:hypothetical protein
MKTVRETVLEAENRKLHAELDYYRYRYGDEGPKWFLDHPINAEIPMTMIQPTLRLAGSWSVSKPEPYSLRVFGHAFPNAGQDPREFQLAYYMTEHELLSTHDALNVLGAMHEKVIAQLADHYKYKKLNAGKEAA